MEKDTHKRKEIIKQVIEYVPLWTRLLTRSQMTRHIPDDNSCEAQIHKKAKK